ncbi:unnamed protein product [Rotaria magnacalcarata]|uniref:Uncharacterized protein n=2 Tax=Rotaria magnacalcarata TaxID=392030 RepID=A0A820HFB3_9BILA|nr:unnamed protein product [Rotaria magnacalcarata]
MNRVLDFLFNVFGFSDNFRMALNKDYEVEISNDSEVTVREEFPSFPDKPATNIKEKNVHQSQNDVFKLKHTVWMRLGVFVYTWECAAPDVGEVVDIVMDEDVPVVVAVG